MYICKERDKDRERERERRGQKRMPSSVALPFGTCEKALADPVNAAVTIMCVCEGERERGRVRE